MNNVEYPLEITSEEDKSHIFSKLNTILLCPVRFAKRQVKPGSVN